MVTRRRRSSWDFFSGFGYQRLGIMEWLVWTSHYGFLYGWEIDNFFFYDFVAILGPSEVQENRFGALSG